MKTKMRVLLLSTAAMLLVMFVVYVAREQKEPIATAHGICAIEQDIYNSVYAPGELEAANENEYAVAHSAVVEDVYVKAGDTVAVGQQLARLRESNATFSEDAVQSFAEAILRDEVADQNAISDALEDVKQDIGEKTRIITANQVGTVLRAPEVGDHILPGITYLKTADTKRLRVRAQIPESYIRQVAEGQSANVTCDAVPDETVAARVTAVAPYARRAASFTGKQQAATVEAVLSLLGSHDTLRPGYTVSVKIFTDAVADAVLVPYEAIRQENDNEYVFVVREGVAHKIYIETGYELDGYIQIKSGVAVGDIVLTDPSETLQDGDKVEVTSA